MRLDLTVGPHRVVAIGSTGHDRLPAPTTVDHLSACGDAEGGSGFAASGREFGEGGEFNGEGGGGVGSGGLSGGGKARFWGKGVGTGAKGEQDAAAASDGRVRRQRRVVVGERGFARFG